MAVPPRKPPRIAGLEPDPDERPFRMLIVGDSGSGKSSVLTKLLRQTLERRDFIIALDVNGGVAEYARAFAPPGTPILDPNPYDAPAPAPRFSEFVSTPTDQLRCGGKFVPDVKGDTSPFFNKRARRGFVKILAILSAFSRWFTLGDAIRLARNVPLAALLGRLSGLGDPWRDLAGNEKTMGDVHATLLSALEPLSVVASLWDHAPETVSILEQARRREGVVVLPWADRLADALEALLAFILESVAERLLEEQTTVPAWFFLDEFRQLQPLKFLGPITQRGRKSGINVAATLLEVPGLEARYGKEEAQEILGMFNHLVVLRCGSVETAEWCARRLGIVEALEDVPPHYTDILKSKGSFARVVRLRENVLPDQIRRNPKANAKKDLIKGWVDFPSGPASFECPFLDDVRLPESKKSPRRPAEQEELREFVVDDIPRLGWPQDEEIVNAVEEFLK